ncbi:MULTISPECIES: hypothetical protein [unclassified Coleofasciculus]|uniref:hypothetical protein n=1 Tax=unclassified Coleofasciculus TaxID=2692782 RepID=UPI001881AC3A|nr:MULTISPECIES: hypothetical protein [unclassified Coleofasciculus]MBE9126799.1 hypothetical protein [Coleofasciculus sp. LEGE 07081]MBE9150170.1 hypothetical protein [Coleofasciculus sp. LEGE 07092]
MPKPNQNNFFTQSSMVCAQPTQKRIGKAGEQQIITVPANSTETPLPPKAGALIPLLMYGGVAVAVIVAMAYFSQIQLKSITELLQAIKKKTK